MARYLGIHVQRGQLDAVETMFITNNRDIAEGLAVKQSAADAVEVGIAGGKRTGVGVAVVRSGKIWAAADDACVPSLSAPAYITAAGKITHEAGDEGNPNTMVGYFTSTEVGENGVQNVPTFTEGVRCVQIFVQL